MPPTLFFRAGERDLHHAGVHGPAVGERPRLSGHHVVLEAIPVAVLAIRIESERGSVATARPSARLGAPGQAERPDESATGELQV